MRGEQSRLAADWKEFIERLFFPSIAVRVGPKLKFLLRDFRFQRRLAPDTTRSKTFQLPVGFRPVMASGSGRNSERVPLELAIHEACARSSEGADLLITAFTQALRSYRRSSVCAPFPSFLISDSKNKNFAFATEAVARFPSTEEIAWSEVQEPEDRDNVVEPLKNLSLEVLMLLNWVLRFRYHLQLVEDPIQEFERLVLLRFPWGSTDLNPSFTVKVQEMEGGRGNSAFETVKNEHGSIMAFHGTTTENLHSILRCGLLNMSKTTLQRNGAMYGEGVYLSTDLSVAVTFSKMGQSWERSCFGSKVSYILLCEIAKGEGVEYSTCSRVLDLRNSSLGTYVVVKNIDLLRIRYVLIYSNHVDTQQQPRMEMRQPVNPVLNGNMSLLNMVIAGYLCWLIVIGFLKGGRSTRLSMLLKQLWWFIDTVKDCLELWLDS
ncbi:hypothetical protein R1flu_016815 [Riccia fluitans]|uniref:Poly [ADP-ribose] polymerase n=1 Tax=Riccia fluitans TaxID=41844 RepID=A0ABD1YNY3_9MARC